MKRYIKSAEIEASILSDIYTNLKQLQLQTSHQNGETETETETDGTTPATIPSTALNLLPDACFVRKYIVKLYSAFRYQDHYCLVYEPLGMSIYEYIKRNKYRGFALPVVQHIIYQLLSAVSITVYSC